MIVLTCRQLVLRMVPCHGKDICCGHDIPQLNARIHAPTTDAAADMNNTCS